jgi:rubrerythrin
MDEDIISACDIIIRARGQLTAAHHTTSDAKMPTEGPVFDFMAESLAFLTDHKNESWEAQKLQGRRWKQQRVRSRQNYYECVGCGNCVDVGEERGACEICGGTKWQPKTT